MKIKTFQFKLSNRHGNLIHNDFSYESERNDITIEEEIDREINEWANTAKVDVVDIKTTTYAVHRHNNDGCDTVIAIYTVLYK